MEIPMPRASTVLFAVTIALLCAPAMAQEPVTANREYVRSADERVYEAPIISVRAVMGRLEHRCWVESDQVAARAEARGVAGEIIRSEPVDTKVTSRCQVVQGGSPDYWEVTYRFRNVEHVVQMSACPGQVMFVNKRGEPRLPETA
jgi:hypothetical protein